jgi:hypothetical protein
VPVIISALCAIAIFATGNLDLALDLLRPSRQGRRKGSKQLLEGSEALRNLCSNKPIRRFLLFLAAFYRAARRQATQPRAAGKGLAALDALVIGNYVPMVHKNSECWTRGV